MLISVISVYKAFSINKLQFSRASWQVSGIGHLPLIIQRAIKEVLFWCVTENSVVLFVNRCKNLTFGCLIIFGTANYTN